MSEMRSLKLLRKPLPSRSAATRTGPTKRSSPPPMKMRGSARPTPVWLLDMRAAFACEGQYGGAPPPTMERR